MNSDFSFSQIFEDFAIQQLQKQAETQDQQERLNLDKLSALEDYINSDSKIYEPLARLKIAFLHEDPITKQYSKNMIDLVTSLQIIGDDFY